MFLNFYQRLKYTFVHASLGNAAWFDLICLLFIIIVINIFPPHTDVNRCEVFNSTNIY